MPVIDRRRFIQGLALAALPASQAASGAYSLGLGIGNYGMQNLPTAEAIRLTAATGYDCIEFALMNDWTTAATKVPAAERKEIHKMLRDADLTVPSMLEIIPVVADAAGHQKNLERLKRDAQLAHDVYPEGPPVLQTHPGGKTQDWERQKQLVVDHLGDWSRLGASMKTVICIKGHHQNIVDTPERLAWVMQQVDSPWIRVIYDYSHFEVAGFGLAETLDLLLPFTKVISLKDSNRNPKDYQRLLPGDGQIDYVDYFGRLKAAHYPGAVVVEVSRQIQTKPGYDLVFATQHSYKNLVPAFEKAGVQRRPRRS